MNMLQKQPKYIKMDMAITRDIHLEPRKQRLVTLLSRFAGATDSFLITEGVESAEEMREALKCGAHMMQGYYFAKPSLDPEIINEMIQLQWDLQ